MQAIVWQPILDGVRTITMRGWVEGRGWLDAANLAGVGRAEATARSTVNSPLPPGAPPVSRDNAQRVADQLAVVGIEVVVERMDGQRFLRVFSVKD